MDLKPSWNRACGPATTSLEPPRCVLPHYLTASLTLSADIGTGSDSDANRREMKSWRRTSRPLCARCGVVDLSTNHPERRWIQSSHLQLHSSRPRLICKSVNRRNVAVTAAISTRVLFFSAVLVLLLSSSLLLACLLRSDHVIYRHALNWIPLYY